jgi:hypothetical protein
MVKFYPSSKTVLWQKGRFDSPFSRLLSLAFFLLLAGSAMAQTPYPMQNGNYLEDFNNITNWTNSFAGSGGEVVPNHSHWGVASNLTTMPVAPNITTTTVFSTGATGGVQRNGTTALALLATGTNLAAAADLYLDFSNRIAGSVSVDWAQLANPTGTRDAAFRVFALNSTDNGWIQLGSDIVIVNGTVSSGTFSQALPTHFNYKANARIRFVMASVGTAGSGSRPRVSLDNITVTSTPCTPTQLVVTSVNSGNCPVVGVPFNVTVQSQSATNNACAVTSNTNVSLGVATGTGSLAGTTTTTFNAASFQNTFNFTALTYDAAETGVTLDASRTSGDVLTTGTSSAFEVIATTAAEPTVQGTISAGTPAFNTVTLTLTPGNGGNRIVVARAGSAVAAAPTDATPYTANAFFGSGSTTGAGQFVVYNGNGSSVSVNGLLQGVNYHFAVFEYNGTGCALNYLPALTGVANSTTPTQTLVAGDVMFVQLRSSTTDGFSFVALRDIGGGTQIRFTDLSWTGSAFVASGVESPQIEYVWTSPLATNGITAGTVVSLQGASVTTGTFTDGVGAATTVANLGTNDQVFAYTGTLVAPSFLAGVSTVPYITIGTATAANSYLPAALAGNFSTALSVTPNENMYLRITNLCGTLTSLRALISNPNNWFNFGNFTVPPDQIFQAPSYWNFSIVGSIAVEPTTSATVTTGALASSSIALNLGAGNGNGRLVVAKLTANATDAVPTDGVVYTANNAYNTANTQIGVTGNYVVFAGSGTSVTVTGLSPLTSYTFTVYEYETAPCINYRATSPGTASASTTVLTYYSKNAQKNNLENLSAWSLTPNELGASPANFTEPGVWYVVDDPNSTIGGAWTVDGASSKVIVGPNASFTIPNTFALATTGGAGLDVRGNSTLTLENNTLPNLLAIDSTNSTVNFDMTGTVTVPAKSYHNLRFRNGTKQLPTGAGINGLARFDNTIRVNGNFVVDGTTIDPSGAPFSFFRCNGNITSLNASVWGSVGDVVTLFLQGTGNQTISKVGAGPDIILFNFNATKSSGQLIFTAGTNLNCQSDVVFNLSGTSFLIDNGVNFQVGDDLRIAGAAGRYNLSGTFTFNNLVNDNSEIDDNNGNAPLAAVNNIVIAGSYIAGSTEFRFRPLAGSQPTTIKGNFSITNSGAIVNMYGNEVRLGGNFSNSATAPGSLLTGTSTLRFIGTTPQTVNTSVVDEVYGSIANQNAAGVTFNQNFTVSRDWTNTSGNFNLSSVTTTFSGTATQNISGLARTTFSNLVLNTTAGTGFTVNPNAKVSLTGTLTFGAGADLTINPGGEFRLVSSPSGTASIANTAAGTVITGNITAERHVPTNGWHLTGTALAGQTIVDWNDDLQTQGPMPGVETPNPGSNTSMIFEHDQTYTTNDGLGELNGWKVPTTSAISNLQGYRVSIPAGSVLDNTGAYSIGTKTFTLTSGGASYSGYNLLINPHLSSVTPTGFSFGGGVQNTVVIWNPTVNQYQYVGSAIAGATSNPAIDPLVLGQGFFVFTTTNGSTLGIPETAKTTGGTFFRTAAAIPGVEIQIAGLFGNRDKAIFQFVPEANASYDTRWDAHKVMNPGINVFTIGSGQERLAINGLSYSGNQVILPVGFRAGFGTYTFALEGLANLSVNTNVFLRDNETNQIIDLNAGQVYTFQVSAAGTYTDRFELIFTQAITDIAGMENQASHIALYPNPVSGDRIQISGTRLEGHVEVEILDGLGRLVDRQSFVSNGHSFGAALKTPAVSGAYSVRIRDAHSTWVKPLVVR